MVSSPPFSQPKRGVESANQDVEKFSGSLLLGSVKDGSLTDLDSEPSIDFLSLSVSKLKRGAHFPTGEKSTNLSHPLPQNELSVEQ